jgi:hypothetical protein
MPGLSGMGSVRGIHCVAVGSLPGNDAGINSGKETAGSEVRGVLCGRREEPGRRERAVLVTSRPARAAGRRTWGGKMCSTRRWQHQRQLKNMTVAGHVFAAAEQVTKDTWLPLSNRALWAPGTPDPPSEPATSIQEDISRWMVVPRLWQSYR